MNLKEELSTKLIGKLTLELTDLQVDIQKQLKIKHLIDEVLNKYEVTSLETALITSDIIEKARIYLATKELEGLSKTTLKNYAYFLNKFADYINKPVSTINTVDLRLFLKFSTSNNKATTINSKIQMLKSFFGWLQNEGYIISNPAAKLKTTKTPKRLRKALTLMEVEKIRESINSLREKAIFEFLLSTGCRVSEVSNLKVSDLNFRDNSAKVIGKGNKERVVFFSTKAALLIDRYLKIRKGDNQYLFTCSKAPYAKLGVRSFQKIISNLAKKAYIDHSVFPHLLRHTFATISANKNISVVALQQLMGHESPETSQKYYELNTEVLKSEYRKVLA